jgi:hypothetical protein
MATAHIIDRHAPFGERIAIPLCVKRQFGGGVWTRAVGPWRDGVWGRSVVFGSGSDLIRSAGVQGLGRSRWMRESFPDLSSRALLTGVGDDLSVHAVADSAFQRAGRFAFGLACRDFRVVVGAAFAVEVADLGDGGHVDCMVQHTVAAP